MRNDFGAGDVFAPYTARHAARRGRIEIILRKEAARNVRGQYFPVEEQRASVGVLGGKFDVVRDGQNGHSAVFQFFEKCGESAYISLLDLQRVFHRMLKMSSLPVYYTQGFNPHIYLSFTCPLSLGQESLCESCEVKTEQETIDPQAWIDALQPLMPRGIVITKVAPAVEKVGEIETAAYEITMPAGSAIALDAYNNAEHAEVTKKTKRGCKTLELKHYLDHIEYTIEGGTLRFTALLPCGSGEALNLNPSLLTDFLRTQGAAPVWQCRVVRTHLYNKAGKDFE